MAIARYPSVVLDCPDPKALATFYGAILDWPVTGDDGSAHIQADYGDSIGFQKVDAYTPPQWPGQQVPQQMHLDVTVDDLDSAEAAVLALGATKHDHRAGHELSRLPRSRQPPLLPLPGLSRRAPIGPLTAPAVPAGRCRAAWGGGAGSRALKSGSLPASDGVEGRPHRVSAPASPMAGTRRSRIRPSSSKARTCTSTCAQPGAHPCPPVGLGGSRGSGGTPSPLPARHSVPTSQVRLIHHVRRMARLQWRLASEVQAPASSPMCDHASVSKPGPGSAGTAISGRDSRLARPSSRYRLAAGAPAEQPRTHGGAPVISLGPQCPSGAVASTSATWPPPLAGQFALRSRPRPVAYASRRRAGRGLVPEHPW